MSAINNASAYQANMSTKAMEKFNLGYSLMSSTMHRATLNQAPRGHMERDAMFWLPPVASYELTQAQRESSTLELWYTTFAVYALIGAHSEKVPSDTQEAHGRRWSGWIATLAAHTLDDACADDRLASLYRPITGAALEALRAINDKFREAREAFSTAYHRPGQAVEARAVDAQAAGMAVLQASKKMLEDRIFDCSSELRLPLTTEIVPIESWWTAALLTSTREVTSYYALVAYLAGKTVLATEQSAAFAKRGTNLQDKFNHKDTWGAIAGQLKLSHASQVEICEVWELDPSFRHAFFVPLTKYEGGVGGVSGNIINTTVKMLKWSHMAHVKIIRDFFGRYPWVPQLFPELSSEIAFLSHGMDRLATVDESTRLYHKLLERDNTDIFDRRVLMKMIGLAKHGLERVDIHIAKYEAEEDPALALKFDRLLKKIEEGADVDTLLTNPREAGLEHIHVANVSAPPAPLASIPEVVPVIRPPDDEQPSVVNLEEEHQEIASDLEAEY
nr:MAG: ORF2 protein [Armillaria cepistipes negative-stranded RNA virus 1]